MGREIKKDNISPAVKRSMEGVELMLESVDVDELPDEKREVLRKIIADYDVQTESLSTFSGEFKELAGKRKQIIVLCEKIAQELNQFTSINAVIATELAKLLSKTETQVIQIATDEENVLENKTIKNESSSGIVQKQAMKDQYVIMETKEKEKKEYDNKKNMRFEDPVKNYSKERNADLTLELEEIEKKIKETRSSLHKVDNDAVNIAMRQEELRKYEKNKADLLARKNENFFANATGGPDTPPKKFAYQPVDRSQNTNIVDDVQQHANAEPKKNADAVPTVDNASVQNVTQVVAQENTTMQSQRPDAVATDTILKRDIPYSGEPVLTGAEDTMQKIEQMKNAQNTTNLVHDPEAAAMGGFDNNEVQPITANQVRGSEVVNRGTMDEEEKFDREVARRAAMNESVNAESSINKENRDTDMNESEKFDREVTHRENVKSQTEVESNRKKKLEEKNARLTEAKNALDNIREMLVVKRRRGETAMNKIRSLLGLQIGATQFSEEIKQLEEEYLKAQKSYSDILSEGTQDMNESEQKKINEEMRFMSCTEARQMYDAESKARLETTIGTVGDKIHKVGLWYKNLPKSVKYSMAAAMFAAGVVTGGAGLTGAAVGTVAVVRRFFGAAAIGAGVGMALETGVEAKKQAAHQSEREKFMSLTIEQQKEILDRMDSDTIQQYNKMQTSRRLIKLASISAAAAVLLGGKAASAAWHAFDGGAAVQNVSNVAQDITQKAVNFSGSNVDNSGESMTAEIAREGSVSKSMEQGIVSGGVTTEWFNAHSSFDETIKDFEKRGFGDTKVFEEFKKMHGKEAFEKFLASHKDMSHEDAMKKWDGSIMRRVTSFEDRMRTEHKINFAHDLAKKMGVDADNLKISSKGGVPVEINGHKVPMELLTEQQQKSIAVSERFSAMMSGRDAAHISNVETTVENDEFMEQFKKSQKLAEDFSERMGVKPGEGGYILYTEGIPVEINGQKVPLNFYSEEQLKIINNSGESVIKKSVEYPGSLKDAPMPTPDQAAFAFAGDAPESNGSVGQSIDPNSTWEKLVDGADPDQTPAGNVYESLGGQKEQVSHAQSFSQNENLHPANSDHATSVSQNENIRGMAVPDLSKMDGIAVDEKTGVGVLTVEKNSNYTKTLAAFLEKNQDRLTGGKMGWDPEKYKNAHEWAMKRATVLANEYRAAHKGVDLNMMQPGTEITLNLNNLSDIKTDVNFEGGPRIVPEGVKVEMTHTTPSGEIAKQIGMSEQVYQVSRDMSMRDYIGDLNNHPNKTPFEEKFLQYTESHPEVMSGKSTLGEVLEKHYKEINSANMERPSASVGHDGVNVETITPEQQLEQEIADYKEKIRDLKFFGEQMKGQTQQIFGMNIENISKAKVNFLAEHNPDVAQKLAVIKKEFGISFNEDTRVGPFMARVVAKSNGKSFEELGIIQS